MNSNHVDKTLANVNRPMTDKTKFVDGLVKDACPMPIHTAALEKRANVKCL